MNGSNEQRTGLLAQHDAPRWQAVDEFVAVPHMSFSRIAFFSSHGGSGTRAVIGACGRELQASPAIIISNNPDSAVIEFAKHAELVHQVINVKICGSEAGVQERILARLQELGVDLIILSGYM